MGQPATIQQCLDALREAVRGCGTAAYGDIDSGLILRTSGATQHRREVLDRLCRQAADGFGLVPGTAGEAPVDPEHHGTMVIAFDQCTTSIFCRDVADGSEFACVVAKDACCVEEDAIAVKDCIRTLGEMSS